jgi:hypothetical protein
VQDRLAGAIARPDGAPAAGPEVRWIGRRHGRRKDRRWARSWSPEQIANRLPLDFPDDPSMRISHEAIYQSLNVQGRGALRRELTACLRTGRALRVPRARTRGGGKGFVRAEIMISDRPAEAEDPEMAEHAQLRIDTGIEIYFCDPHSPWQRGSNENANGLLRQYFPRGTDLSRHAPDELAAVALRTQHSPTQDARLAHTGRSPQRPPARLRGTRDLSLAVDLAARTKVGHNYIRQVVKGWVRVSAPERL